MEQGSEEGDGTGASFRSHRGTTTRLFSEVWAGLTRKDRNMVGKFQKSIAAVRGLKRQEELVNPGPKKAFAQ